jgi:hypothetical protein
MATKQITIERFSVISAKTFAEVASAIAGQVGHPDIKQFYEAIQAAEDDQELQRVVNRYRPKWSELPVDAGWLLITFGYLRSSVCFAFPRRCFSRR